MKIPPIFLFLLMGILNSSAQIERKSAVDVKADTAVATSTEKFDGKQNPKDRLSDLNLTREQRIKLKIIREANTKAKTAIENNAQLSEKEKKMQLRELHKKQAQKVQAILTDEQKATFKDRLAGIP